METKPTLYITDANNIPVVTDTIEPGTYNVHYAPEISVEMVPAEFAYASLNLLATALGETSRDMKSKNTMAALYRKASASNKEIEIPIDVAADAKQLIVIGLVFVTNSTDPSKNEITAENTITSKGLTYTVAKSK